MSSSGIRFGQVWASRDEVDRLVWVARGMLEEQVAELHPQRPAAVAGRIRELIGN